MDKLKVIIVDDHPLFRQGVVDTISLESDFEIVGEASDGDDALALVREIRPHVVVLDVNLPGQNGLQVTRAIKTGGLPTRVVLVTAYNDAEQIIHAVRSGASAFCPKHIRPEELVEVVRHVAKGKYVINGTVLGERELQSWVERHVVDTVGPYRDAAEPLHPLSNREMEVLSYVTQGMSNKEIAMLLEISYQTVKNHVTSILRKLNVDDRTQAAVYALRRGWFRLYEPDEDIPGLLSQE
ncbi:MAG: response regulator transcription factor [Chloroflexi bacterium]|jgi:DNA-binding NarL/FixJ family response regulator|nr:response regulator transcription factor [Chloroflexota bacterium]